MAKKRRGNRAGFVDWRNYDFCWWRNAYTFTDYYDRLLNIALGRFVWEGLPETCNSRFLELCLLVNGDAVFFNDEDIGWLTLMVRNAGRRLSVYREPVKYQAYSNNYYGDILDDSTAVLIHNNMSHTNSVRTLQYFAYRMYELDITIDINARAQKTPILLKCPENMRLTMQQVYKDFVGNAPVIYGEKELFPNSIEVMNTGAPYVGDKLYELRNKIWDECMAYLGVPGHTNEKRERLTLNESVTGMGGMYAQRWSPLHEREEAARKMSKLSGYEITVRYNDDWIEQLKTMSANVPETGGEVDE